METEPETEDVDNFDDKKLAEQFYRYHINPDWLNVRRIINHRPAAGKKKDYLILWRGLSYAEVSWIEEDRDEIPGREPRTVRCPLVRLFSFVYLVLVRVGSVNP